METIVKKGGKKNRYDLDRECGSIGVQQFLLFFGLEGILVLLAMSSMDSSAFDERENIASI